VVAVVVEEVMAAGNTTGATVVEAGVRRLIQVERHRGAPGPLTFTGPVANLATGPRSAGAR
jgi:hypothetical protein